MFFSWHLMKVISFTLTHSNEATKIILPVCQAHCFTCIFSLVLWLYLLHLIKCKLLVFIRRAPPSPLQYFFSFLLQYQVPSASTWLIMPTFIVHVFNFQTSAFMLPLRQPSNVLGWSHLQISAKPPHCSSSPIFPLFLLHCLFNTRLWCQDPLSAHQAGKTMVFSCLFVPLSFCSYLVVFCVLYSSCKLVKGLFS